MRLKLTCKYCRRNIQIESEQQIAGTISCPNCTKPIELPPNILDVDMVIGGFKIVKHLGSGSMGSVYLARQLSMDRLVALKILSPHLTEDKEEIDHFFHEIRTLAKLDHPNIVTAFEAGQHEKYYYFAMTYVQGETLEEKLIREGKIDQELAIKIAVKIGDALQYAWEHFHLLHRDIKPENIMLDEVTGEPKLLDLGICKVAGEENKKTISSEGLLVGTPYYMSPEQAKHGGQIDIRSDMYAFGCTLFHLVTGEVPYPGESLIQVITKHALDPVPDAREKNPSIHPSVSRFIKKAMAKNPADRFLSWKEWIKSAKQVLRDIKTGGKTKIKTPIPHVYPLPDGKTHSPNVGGEATKPEDSEERILLEEAEVPKWMQLCKKISVVGVLILLFATGILLYAKYNRPTEMNHPSSHLPSSQNPEHPTPTPPPPPSLPSPSPSPPKQPSPEEIAYQEWFEKINKRFQLLQNQYQGNRSPEKLEEYDAQLELLLKDAKNHPLEGQIRNLYLSIKKDITEGVESTIRSLQEKANAYLSKRDYDRAIAVYKNYNGPFVAATAPLRNDMVMRLRQQQVIYLQSQHTIREKIEAAIYPLYSKNPENAIPSIDLILNENFVQTTPQLKEKLKLISQAARVFLLIADSFKENIGQTIEVPLKNGKLNLLIRGINGYEIDAAQTIQFSGATGRVKHNFQVTSLTLEEQIRRLNMAQHPAFPVMKSILYNANGMYEKAVSSLAEFSAPSLLLDVLKTYAVFDQSKLEDYALVEYIRMLDRLRVNIQSPPQSLVQNILQIKLDAIEKVRVQNLVNLYKIRYNKTSTYKKNESVIQAIYDIAQLSSEFSTPLIPQDFLQAIQTIKRRNHLPDTFEPDLYPTIGGWCVIIRNEPALKDISPLKDLSIRELELEDVKVSDLSPFTGKSLRKLTLRRCPVTSLEKVSLPSLILLTIDNCPITSLSDIKNFPALQALAIPNTPIKDLSPLVGTGISYLDIRSCNQIQNLEVIQKMNNLQTLIVSPDLPQLSQLQQATHIQRIGFSPEAVLTTGVFFERLKSLIKK